MDLGEERPGDQQSVRDLRLLAFRAGHGLVVSDLVGRHDAVGLRDPGA